MTEPGESPIPWVEPHQALPAPQTAWGPASLVPGLLVASRDIGAERLLEAYRMGVFPWYAENQPVLWWYPSPRMVLRTNEFRFHRSLRKWVAHGLASGDLSIRFDHDFEAVIQACATARRRTQSSTWIMPELIDAYVDLHREGYAHSVETWWQDQRIGGLYCVNVGRMVFGESMYSTTPNASKAALAALVAFCSLHGMGMIDCQQETEHLALMGARPIPASDFAAEVASRMCEPAPPWTFVPEMWQSWNHRLATKVQPG